MDKILINGVPAINFGTNNYSYGLEAIIFNPKDISVEEVAKLPNIFLHPTEKPNSLEIFALRGTKEQFDEFYKECSYSYSLKQTINEFGGMPNTDEPSKEDIKEWDKFHNRVEELNSSFKPWYDNK